MESTSVIIIGGGPVGLSASILLSLRHIPHILFERHTTTSIHPKACGINQRTTEIFRVMGIEDEVYAHAAPPEIASRTAWYTGFGEAGREIVSRDAWGGRQYADEYAAASASRYSVLPQIRLEPILQRRAAALNPDGIRCGAEVTDVRPRRTASSPERRSEGQERRRTTPPATPSWPTAAARWRRNWASSGWASAASSTW